MPPFPSVPNALKLVIEGNYLDVQSTNWANVYHFAYTGAPFTPHQAEDLAFAALAAYEAQFGPLTVPQQQINQCTVTDLSSDMGSEGVSGPSILGSSTADKLPGNVCVLASKRVARRYRGGHFRTYLACGADENLLDQANWNSAFVTAVQSAYANFIGAVLAFSEGGFGISGEIGISYYQGIDPITHLPIRRVAPLVLPIVEVTIQPEIASQRGRVGRRR